MLRILYTKTSTLDDVVCVGSSIPHRGIEADPIQPDSSRCQVAFLRPREGPLPLFGTRLPSQTRQRDMWPHRSLLSRKIRGLEQRVTRRNEDVGDRAAFPARSFDLHAQGAGPPRIAHGNNGAEADFEAPDRRRGQTVEGGPGASLPNSTEERHRKMKILRREEPSSRGSRRQPGEPISGPHGKSDEPARHGDPDIMLGEVRSSFRDARVSPSRLHKQAVKL
jgi:hypothetical protein